VGQTKETDTLFCNKYGQIQCHGCGCYSDLIYPVHVCGNTSSWVSMVCQECNNWPPGCRVVRVDDPIDLKVYGGPIVDV
jgi:hypothetical protein